MPNPAACSCCRSIPARAASGAFAAVMGLAARQGVARIVEMHDGLQTREIPVVSVRLHEVRIRAALYIAQGRHLKPRAIARRQLEPSVIYFRGLTKQMSLRKKTADATIHEGRPFRVGGIAECIRPAFLIIGKSGISGGSDVAGGEVGEQRVLARAAVAVTGVA